MFGVSAGRGGAPARGEILDQENLWDGYQESAPATDIIGIFGGLAGSVGKLVKRGRTIASVGLLAREFIKGTDRP